MSDIELKMWVKSLISGCIAGAIAVVGAYALSLLYSDRSTDPDLIATGLISTFALFFAFVGTLTAPHPPEWYNCEKEEDNWRYFRQDQRRNVSFYAGCFGGLYAGCYIGVMANNSLVSILFFPIIFAVAIGFGTQVAGFGASFAKSEFESELERRRNAK